MNICGRPLQLLAFSVFAAALAANAHAQVVDVDSAVAHMGVGAGITFNKPLSSEGSSAQGVTFVYRWHSFHSGWGPTFGLDWHSNDFNRSIGDVDAPLGTLRTRALLAGYGHTRHYGRFSASASVSGGYTFNDFSVSSGAGPAFATSGLALQSVSVGNNAVFKPEISAWYDVFRHVGVGVSAAYLLSRPDETIVTAAGSQTQRLNADTFELTVGLTFGVWRKHT
ncbi:MAG TPA: hypothetical protein VLV86_11340 [Vicinamibacterales bacterium]|nr:hypothetical protein [Vicinamibacterales bacterium]